MLKLRRMFEEWLGVGPVAAGEDTQWSLRFSLGWPDWVAALFLLFSLLFVVWIYQRESSRASRTLRLALAGVRLTLVLLLLAMIGGLEVAIDRTGLPYLVFMVDDSESMRTRDLKEGESEGARQSSRIETVAQWLGKEDGAAIAALTEKHKVQFYANSLAPRLLGTAIAPSDVEGLVGQIRELSASGTESRLGANLRTVLNNLRGAPPSAVVLITDGVVTDGESLSQAGQYAKRKSIPVFTVGVGDPGGIRDLDLHDLLVDSAVFVDDLVAFEAKLGGQGLEGREIPVTLKQKGSDQVLDRQVIRIPADGKPAKVRLTHRPTQPGVVDYVLDAPLEPRELHKENNRIERQVQVIKEKIRVLYVESYPRFEFRFLKSLLEREPTIDAGVLLLDADPEYVQQDKTAVGFFPTSKKDLFAYDVIILGDVSPASFSQVQLEMMRDFVWAKGGGLLFIAGEQYSPAAYRDTVLAQLLPVEIGPATNRDPSLGGQGFSPKMTLEGRASPIFRFAADDGENEAVWNSLPPIFWYARVEKAKPVAQVLVEHPTDKKNSQATPLVASQFYGAGRTYYQGFDSTWRWRYRVEDRYFARYWVQAIRYLSRSKLLGKNRLVELMTDRQKYRRGEPVQLRVRFLDESLAPRGDDAVTVSMESDRAGPRIVALRPTPDHSDAFEGTFAQSEDGKYRLRVASPILEGSPPSAEFTVVPPPGELDRVQMNEPDLREVAEATGAKFARIAEADEILAELPSGRRVALHTDPPIPLWNTWAMLSLFGGLLILEWIVRKTRSML